ncbi:MAG: recombination regulator RecX [Treponema sp.]|nr:recombination regulator RecX [Treponema sp.]
MHAAGSSSANVSLDTAEYIKAEKIALALVARAEQCTHGLKYKLEKKKIPVDIIQKVLDHLVELNLVNDLRYAQLWLKMKIGRGNKGPRMLSLLLKAKGIDNETIDAALAAVLTPEVEIMLLKSCLDKATQDKKDRANIINAKTPDDSRNAIRRFLKMEGFSVETIDSYFNE